MIFIIGTKERIKADNQLETTDKFCHSCGFFSSFTAGTSRSWLTLFFIPVFPFGKKTPVITCSRCGQVQKREQTV